MASRNLMMLFPPIRPGSSFLQATSIYYKDLIRFARLGS